jgi:hypothetical protein
LFFVFDVFIFLQLSFVVVRPGNAGVVWQRRLEPSLFSSHSSARMHQATLRPFCQGLLFNATGPSGGNHPASRRPGVTPHRKASRMPSSNSDNLSTGVIL